jgi:hypothetical protein
VMFSISVSLLQVINRTSLGIESDSPAIYDLRRMVYLDIFLIEDSDSWVLIVYYIGSVSVNSRAIIVFLLRSVSVQVRVRSGSGGYYNAFLGREVD